MAAEGEFAFVIAAFAVTNAMITEELYASIVLAVLVSTIVAPFCLRYSISHFNKRVQETIIAASDPSSDLEDGIRKQTTVFYCIQIKSAPAWGIQSAILGALNTLELDVIDHRSWHPRQSDDLLVNEIYAIDASEALEGKAKLEVEKQLNGRIVDVSRMLEGAINQESAIVKVMRWYPEPLLSETGDISERLVKATGTALSNSMRSEDAAYIQMAEKDGKVERRMSGHQVGHLDPDFEGRLDGIIRHDPPVAVTSDEGIELLDTHGVAVGRRDSGPPKMDSRWFSFSW